MTVLMGLHVTIASLNAVIGCYVLYKNPRSIVHRAIFVMAIGIAGWMIGILLLVATANFLFVSLAIWSGELAVLGFVAFAQTFPDQRAKLTPALVWLPLLLVAIGTPLHLIIASVTPSAHGYLRPENGPFFAVFASVMIGYVIVGAFYLARTFSHSRGVQRVQMRYFLFGAGTFLFCATVFDIILPAFKIFSFNLVGPLSSIIFVGFASYAIVQHSFLDIEVIIKKSVAYFAAIAVAAIFFFSFEFVVEKFYFNDEVVDIVAAVIGAALFSRLHTWFVAATDKIFFRADYDYARAVRDLGLVLASTIELGDLIAGIDEFLAHTIKPTKTVFSLYSAADPYSFVHGGQTNDRNPEVLISRDDAILGNYSPRDVVISQESEGSPDDNDRHDFVRFLVAHNFSAAVPFRSKDEAIGMLFVGEKLSDDILRPKDIALLATLSHQGSMALENARLYDSIQRSKEELEDIVAERTAEIRAMYRTQEQFVTDISHQLQTPIAILEGNLELAEQRSTGHTKSSLKTIRETVDGMANLVSNFLEIAKLNFSKNKFHTSRFDVGELMGDTYDDCVVLAETKGVLMTCQINKATVDADKRKIKEVILNLISNALKHTDANGTIELSVNVVGDFAELVVRDTGAGIPAENVPHLFERFYRIPGSGASGNGLGLNICREIIEMHGGTIGVESRVGKGSAFTVRLPLAVQNEPIASAIL